MHPSNNIVVFDGACNLCAHSVRFILTHEAGPTLAFVPLQSPYGAKLMGEFGFDPADASTFILIAGGRAHVKSDAAIRVSAYLRWPWKLLAAIRIIPRPIRDRAYDLVARNRIRWFGSVDACMLPTPETRARFPVE